MKKNETQFNFNANLAKNNSINLKNGKSKSNNFISRNSFFKIKNNISSKFELFTNSTIFNNHSKGTLNINEELPKIDINSNQSNKNISSNSVNNANFLKRISYRNNRSKALEHKIYYMKNNTNFMSTINISQFMNGKKDSNKHKILLRQRNGYIRYQQEDYVFSSYYFQNKKPFIKNIKKHFINEDRFNKFCFEIKNLNNHSAKDIFSVKKSKSSQNKSNSFKVKKIPTKYKVINILKRSRELLLTSKNNNLNKEKKENEKNENNLGYIEQNISSGTEKTVDDNCYNKYLKDISLPDSNKSKYKRKILSKNEGKCSIKNLKPLRKNLSLNDTSEIFQYTKRLNQYNYPNALIKNIKNLKEFKKKFLNELKNLDYFNKDVVLENLYLRKKIMIEKNILS